MSKMWNRSKLPEEEMDNGWSPRQIRQENATRNRTFRLPEMPQTIPSCPKQTQDLKHHTNGAHARPSMKSIHAQASPLFSQIYSNGKRRR